MNIRTLSLALLAAAASSPSLCGASGEADSASACARAFAASMSVGGAAVPAFKFDYRARRSSASIADYFTATSTFELMAHDPKTGAIIARARCTTNASGEVLKLLPLGATATTSALARN